MHKTEHYVFNDWKNREVRVYFSKVETCPGKSYDLMTAWVKAGYMKELLPSYWTVTVEVDDDGLTWNGNKFGYGFAKDYKRYDNKGKLIESRYVIDFDWILEATEENKQVLLNEIKQRINKVA